MVSGGIQKNKQGPPVRNRSERVMMPAVGGKRLLFHLTLSTYDTFYSKYDVLTCPCDFSQLFACAWRMAGDD